MHGCVAFAGWSGKRGISTRMGCSVEYASPVKTGGRIGFAALALDFGNEIILWSTLKRSSRPSGILTKPASRAVVLAAVCTG